MPILGFAGSYAKTLGRLLVCLYFVNIVYEDYETYRFMSTPEMMARAQRFPERYPAPMYPYIEVLFLLPCALLAILGWRVPLTGTILVLDMLKDSGLLIWNQTYVPGLPSHSVAGLHAQRPQLSPTTAVFTPIRHGHAHSLAYLHAGLPFAQPSPTARSSTYVSAVALLSVALL